MPRHGVTPSSPLTRPGQRAGIRKMLRDPGSQHLWPERPPRPECMIEVSRAYEQTARMMDSVAELARGVVERVNALYAPAHAGGWPEFSGEDDAARRSASRERALALGAKS